MALNSYNLEEVAVNDYNFIWWYRAGSLSANPEIPNRLNKVCKDYKPSFVVGERYSVWCNSFELLEDTDTANWQLAVIDKDDNIISDDITTLFFDVPETGKRKFYFYNDNFPTIAEGEYYFAVYNSVTDDLKYKSTVFKVWASASDWATQLTKVKYKDSLERFYFNYPHLSIFYNEVFLDISMLGSSPATTIRTYEEASTGNTRTYGGEIAWTKKFKTHLFDEKAHRAMAILLMAHDEIYFNNKRFQFEVQAGYNPNSQDNIPVSSGDFQMREHNFQLSEKI